MKKVRLLSLLSVTALVTTVLVTAPTVANAAPACDGKSPIQSCVGAVSYTHLTLPTSDLV